ncbi:SapC family protein [Pseudomonas syringae]|uniref:SapC family protein n=1 Tax=Pseudomonas syringae TaxID=317 RepID=UPI00067B353E|nr:SapC family protein [Pseudomonas syringae]
MAYVPLSKELHGDKCWTRHSSMLFAKTDTVSPLLVSDLGAAVQALPIAFVKHGGQFVLVTVMGLRPEENLLVSPQGEWLSEYMPALYRSSPFELVPAGERYALAIDDACLSDDGAALFTEDGEITEDVRDLFERVQRINETKALTQHACSVLAEHNLIKPWPITFTDGPDKQEIAGLYCVDEEAFNALDDVTFLLVRQAQALPVVYAQFYSMRNLSILGRFAEHRPSITNDATANDTFSFAGL